jgi:flagellum-specific peptidoglycan hydrolase FlgJ
MLSRKDWTIKNAPLAYEVTKGTGIYAETLLAMAIVESQGKVNGIFYPGAGLVARKANNYFGIKKGVNWKGKTISLPTPGDADKISVFRVYNSFEESAKDYINFLKRNKRYEKAGVFTAPNYQEQIINIARAGYAESTNYANVITSVANSVKKNIENLILEPLKKNNKIIPLLIGGLIVSLYILKNKIYGEVL